MTVFKDFCELKIFQETRYEALQMIYIWAVARQNQINSCTQQKLGSA